MITANENFLSSFKKSCLDFELAVIIQSLPLTQLQILPDFADLGFSSKVISLHCLGLHNKGCKIARYRPSYMLGVLPAV